MTGPLVNVVVVELAGVAAPLRALARLAFVAVVAAALFVDVWITGEIWGSSFGRVGGSQLISTAIAVVGVAWALWPRHVLVWAVLAATLSLLMTSGVRNDNLRIGVFTELAVMPVLLAAVLALPVATRWPVAAYVVVAAEAIALRVEGGPIRAVVAMSMLVLLGLGAAAVVYVRVRDNDRRASIERVRQSERLDLARELHDIVGHHVTGIVVLAQASRFTSGATPGSPADQAFADIETAGIETLTSVRRLVGLLRTDTTTSAGPQLADVERIVAGLRTTHAQTQLQIGPELRAAWVPPDVANTVLRLVQEAATNVRRHGDPAGPVLFDLRSPPGWVELVVENRMARPVAAGGYGIVGMRERVDAYGGTFEAGPRDDAWRVCARLPIIDRVEVTA